MSPTLMHLKVLLPFEIFADKFDVTRIVADTNLGSFGLLPHRLDCVAALSAGILVYQTEGADEAYMAIDEGVLVKTGFDVLVSVRNAISGADLGQLRQVVQQQFLNLNKSEENIRSVMSKMETGLIHKLVEFSHE
jgi:F-type H+-transporting ATPase subunit epsilon